MFFECLKIWESKMLQNTSRACLLQGESSKHPTRSATREKSKQNNALFRTVFREVRKMSTSNGTLILYDKISKNIFAACCCSACCCSACAPCSVISVISVAFCLCASYASCSRSLSSAICLSCPLMRSSERRTVSWSSSSPGVWAGISIQPGGEICEMGWTCEEQISNIFEHLKKWNDHRGKGTLALYGHCKRTQGN